MADSYYRFFPGDYQRDTGDLTLMEHGAYRVLLDHYYTQGCLPFDLPRLYRICRAFSTDEQDAVATVVKRFFQPDGNQLRNRKADREITERASFLKAQSERGKRSARLREARSKGTHTETEWNALVEAANGVCPRCGSETDVFDKDHIIPIYQGGSDGIDNIQPLCPRCNSSKGPESVDFFKHKRAKALVEPRAWLEPEANLPSPSPSPLPTKDKKSVGDKSPRFAPPSPTEIENYCRESGHTIDVQRFHDFYESKGWMVGKNKMKDWKAAVRNWAREGNEGGKTGNGTKPPQTSPFTACPKCRKEVLKADIIEGNCVHCAPRIRPGELGRLLEGIGGGRAGPQPNNDDEGEEIDERTVPFE